MKDDISSGIVIPSVAFGRRIVPTTGRDGAVFTPRYAVEDGDRRFYPTYKGDPDVPVPPIAATDYPFDITIVGTTATFRAGSINGVLPSNYLTGITVAASGTEYLVLNCTASNGQITSASFSSDASQPGAISPIKGQPPTSFSMLIGLSIDAVPFKVWGNGNIQADSIEAFRVDRSPLVPGAPSYETYYNWTFRLV